MAILDTVKAIAPIQTSGLSDAEITAFIELAQDRLSLLVWGTRLYPQGVAYLTAHLLTVTFRGSAGGGSGAAGPVRQEMAGRVMVSYAASSDAASTGLRSTPYGEEFLNLRKKLPGIRPFTTGFESGEMSGR
jgi:hypothetical protein